MANVQTLNDSPYTVVGTQKMAHLKSLGSYDGSAFHGRRAHFADDYFLKLSCYWFPGNVFFLKVESCFFASFCSPPRIKNKPDDDGFYASPKEDSKPLKRPREDDE